MLAEPMTEEASAKYANAEEIAEGAQPILRLPPTEAGPLPWSRDRLHDAAKAAGLVKLAGQAYEEVRAGRLASELTEADWREMALRLGLDA